MTRVSILDLSPVSAGVPASQAVRNTVDLARALDGLGFTRYWLAEHHAIPSVASSAPEVLIGHVAAATTHMRVGSGGIMLPNHAPLRVAEEFKVLEALHPDRIDLGIGRAPGTDQLTAFALRRSREAMLADDFEEQLGELLAFGGQATFRGDHPFSRIRAIPDDVQLPPIYLLGSSDHSAGLAARLGLGFAFAAHINPRGADDAMRLYRREFNGERPHAILAVAAVVGEDDEHARRLAAPAKVAFVKLRSSTPIPLPSVEDALAYLFPPHEEALARAVERNIIVGDEATVRAQIEERVVATQADEVMVTTHVHDHADREASYRRLAEALDLAPADASSFAA
jgi:luciferase family oxidoreductase group 1